MALFSFCLYLRVQGFCNIYSTFLTLSTIDITKEFGPSKSGKSITIASTEGNVSIPDHDEIKIGLNIYRKN